MSKKGIIGTIVLLAVIVGAIFYMPDTWKFWRGQTANVINSDDQNANNQVPVHETITAKHQFKNGHHIIAGEVNLPTPCYILDTTTQVSGSAPEEVTVQFTASSSDEVCAQVLTTNRFKVEFDASEQAVIRGTWNGVPVSLNLIPVGPNEDLINFEVFIKG